MSIKLSICIPTYNRVDKLKNLFQSISNDEKNIEVIIVDDGSTDRTKDFIGEEIKSREHHVKYIYQENQGVSKAMHTAYMHSNGEFCIKMDSDDVFFKNGLEIILKRLNDFNNINNELSKIGNKNFISGMVFGVKTIRGGNVGYNKFHDEMILNYHEFRGDYGIKGDFKEVVKTEIVKDQIYDVPDGVRRIPPSLLWVKIAEFYDFYICPEVIAVKEFGGDGINKKILHLKTKYSDHMRDLYEYTSKSNSYKSFKYKVKANINYLRYSMHSKSKIDWDIVYSYLILPSYFIYLIDKMKLNIRKLLG